MAVAMRCPGQPAANRPPLRSIQPASARGKKAGGQLSWKLLFDDCSDCLHCQLLMSDQSDRSAQKTDQDGTFIIVIQTREGEKLRLSGRYRVVAEFPYLNTLGYALSIVYTLLS